MALTLSLILSILSCVLGLISVIILFTIASGFKGAFRKNFTYLAIGVIFAFISSAFLISEDLGNASVQPEHVFIDITLSISALIILVAASKFSRAVKLIPAPYLKTIGQIN